MVVSVIVPLFKGKSYIETITRLIEENTIYLQSNLDDKWHVELILVNDYPKECIEIEGSAPYECILVNHAKNMGIHKSRVDGLAAAKGDYILFLDQDDTISEEYLFSQISNLLKSDAEWVLCNGIFRGNQKIYKNNEDVQNVLDSKHYFTNLTEIISPGQVVLKKDIIPKLWRENVLNSNYCDDAFLWMLLKNQGEELAYNSKVLFFHNENDDNTSFDWKSNACALRELKTVINDIKCLKGYNIDAFNKTIENEINKHQFYAKLQEGYARVAEKDFREFFYKKYPNKQIVIYGYGIWGKRLHSIINKNGLTVGFICDKNGDSSDDRMKIHKTEELLSGGMNLDQALVIVSFYDVGDAALLSLKKSHVNWDCISISCLFDELLGEDC